MTFAENFFLQNTSQFVTVVIGVNVLPTEVHACQSKRKMQSNWSWESDTREHIGSIWFDELKFWNPVVLLKGMQHWITNDALEY